MGVPRVTWASHVPTTLGDAQTVLDELPRVIAHRGFHANATGPFENTLEAFQKAIDVGADRLEMDVQRTLDGVLVIHHDPDVDGRAIAEMNYADLPLVGNGYRIPTLTEVAQLAKRRGAQMDVEIKASEGLFDRPVGYEQQIIDELLAKNAIPTSQFHISSFSKKSLAAVEAYRPDVVTMVLAPRIPGWLRDSVVWPVLARILDPLHLSLRSAEKVGADLVSVDQRMVTDGLLNAAARRGIGVDVWTVDDQMALARMVRDPRIHGVVTNKPDLALKLRDQAVEGAAQIG